jgi:4-hydroxy-tetrahydrodipicolinate reductase
MFTSATEQITLTHHALDRRIFADGAVQAALFLATRPAGLYGMRDLLGL